MGALLLLILASLSVALFFLGSFIWAARSGQFDDTCTPSLRILADERSRPTDAAQPPSKKT